MAAKGYMTDFNSLRKQFDLTVGRNKDSTAWNLYRGHQDTLSERRGIIYKQDEEDMNEDESFNLLQQLIENNSAGGGDFTVYFPKRGAAQHQHGSIFFRVESANNRQGVTGLSGYPVNPAAMGYITREEFALQQQLWQLQRENEDLKATVEAPPSFIAGIAQQAVENGTVERLLSGIMGLLEKTVTGFAIKNGIRPQINLSGLEGQPVSPIMPPQPNQQLAGEETDTEYPEEMYQFADYIFQTIGTDPALQAKFWTNLKLAAIAQPTLIQQLLQ